MGRMEEKLVVLLLPDAGRIEEVLVVGIRFGKVAKQGAAIIPQARQVIEKSFSIKTDSEHYKKDIVGVNKKLDFLISRSFATNLNK